MALSTDLSIYKASMKLHLLCLDGIKNMRRDLKVAASGPLTEDCRQLMLCIRRANSVLGKARIEQIEQARERLELINLQAQACRDLRPPLISKEQYAAIIRQTEDIGRQATGWKNKTESALATTPPRSRGQCANELVAPLDASRNGPSTARRYRDTPSSTRAESVPRSFPADSAEPSTGRHG